MVQIAPVEYPKLPFEFEFLRVERIGGIAGVHERLSIERRDALLGVTINAHVQEPREFLLDASQAEHLLGALEPLAGGPPPLADGGSSGADMFSYVVEIGWSGQVQRFEVEGVPSDDALHGVLEFAARLLELPDPVDVGGDGAVSSRPS